MSRFSRMHILTAVLFAVGFLLVFRLYFIQVLSHAKWKEMAEDQHSAFQRLVANRGEIFMHDSDALYPLAVNREYQMAYAVPKDIDDRDHVAIELSQALGMDIQSILEKLNRPDDPFEIIKKRLSDDETTRIRDLGIKGIALMPEEYRYYPAGELASQVVGFANLDDQESKAGSYGIESSQDGRLSGMTGQVKQEKDAGGRWIPLSDRSIISAQDGDSIILTLDRVIQYETEKILKDAVDQYQADRATAIIMEPQTGRILSMASFPQFDPNEYSKVEDYSLFMNPALSMSYEPGSIMKPLTMAIGLEEKKVSPETEYVDTGSVQVGGFTIHNSENKVYGRSNMYKVLDQSINTGVIFVEKLVGNASFGDYVRRFGFGERTGIELPAELSGNVRNLDNVRSDTQYYTISFGQGIAVTPIQIVSAYAALANGGQLMRPHIIDAFIHADGTKDQVEPEIIRRVVSEDTSQMIGKMLRDVVVNGHGKHADVPGYLVGGKTGTAQVAKSDGKGYEDGVSIGSFAGYAPINDPRFAVLVKLDNPKNVEWAESSAAPTFGKIMAFLLEYAKIRPTETINATTAASTAAKGESH